MNICSIKLTFIFPAHRKMSIDKINKSRQTYLTLTNYNNVILDMGLKYKCLSRFTSQLNDFVALRDIQRQPGHTLARV